MNNFSEFNPTPNIPTENNGGSNFFYYVNINLNSGGLLGFPGQIVSGQRISGQRISGQRISGQSLNQLQSGAIQGDYSVDGMRETALAVQKLSTSIFHGQSLSQKLHVDNKPEVKLSNIVKKHPQSSDIQSQELQDRIDNIRSSINELNTKLDILGSKQQLSLREENQELTVDIVNLHGEITKSIEGETSDIIKKTQTGVGLLLDRKA